MFLKNFHYFILLCLEIVAVCGLFLRNSQLHRLTPYSVAGTVPVAGSGRGPGDPAPGIAENRPVAYRLRRTGLPPRCITENRPVAGLGRGSGEFAGT